MERDAATGCCQTCSQEVAGSTLGCVGSITPQRNDSGQVVRTLHTLAPPCLQAVYTDNFIHHYSLGGEVLWLGR